MSTTTNFGWTKPTVYGDVNVWGAPLNNNLDSQDSYMKLALTSNAAATEPTYKALGTTWLDTSSSPYDYQIYDGTDWITIGTLNPTTNSFVVTATGFSVGDYKWSAISSDHDGWLLCDGSSVSTTTYATLFAVIGYAFGGSGATFQLPDARGRVAGGIGTGSGLTTRSLGDSVGAETHTLITSEIPAHTHTISSSTGPLSGPSNNVGSTGNSVNTVTSNSTGGDGAHNNMQPTLFIGNMFIYSGV